MIKQLNKDEKSEVFRFNPSTKEQSFISTKGTQIIVPSDAFVFEDGSSPTAAIEFELVEFYDASSWFLNKLSTETTDGQLLQTAVMVKTQATSNGQSLKTTSEENNYNIYP